MSVEIFYAMRKTLFCFVTPTEEITKILAVAMRQVQHDSGALQITIHFFAYAHIDPFMKEVMDQFRSTLPKL